MKQITYKDMAIGGIEYSSIVYLQIHQHVCEHATATISVVVDSSYGTSFIEHVTEKDLITLFIFGQKAFVGAITSVNISAVDDGVIMNLQLISTSKFIDYSFESHSYQNVGVPYLTVMKKSVGSNGTVKGNFDDKGTQGILIQYQETAWAFVRRLALNCNAIVSPDIRANKATVFVGEAVGGGAIPQVGSLQNGRVIAEVESALERGELVTTVRTVQPEQVFKEISGDYMGNPVVGKIFAGEVKVVDVDRIKAHITDIDSEYEEGNWWFPYSTIYSSPTMGAGIYSMPKEGEPVRLFFPSAESADAFAASSLNAREIGETPKEKVFTAPTGMGVKFFENGLSLYTDDRAVSIELKADGDIVLTSNKKIEILSKQNVYVTAAEQLDVNSDKEIYIGTKQSFIDLNANDGGTMDIYSQKIFMK